MGVTRTASEVGSNVVVPAAQRPRAVWLGEFLRGPDENASHAPASHAKAPTRSLYCAIYAHVTSAGCFVVTSGLTRPLSLPADRWPPEDSAFSSSPAPAEKSVAEKDHLPMVFESAACR